MSEEKKLTGMRAPFPAHQISKLPKPTKQQTDEVKADFRKGVRCLICGGWHHKDVIHLDYVGHAALTDRLLDVDPDWQWEPFSCDAQTGLPKFDSEGGLWIKLTVLGVTRPGYGHPDGKKGGDAIKEAIGDALRNASMRFGAALDLWHKGDLHIDDKEPEAAPAPSEIELVNATDISAIRAKLIATNKSEVSFCAHYKISRIEDMPKDWAWAYLTPKPPTTTQG